MEVSTVRKIGKLKRWESPLFEKWRDSNGGSVHCSKNEKTQTVDDLRLQKLSNQTRKKAHQKITSVRFLYQILNT